MSPFLARGEGGALENRLLSLNQAMVFQLRVMGGTGDSEPHGWPIRGLDGQPFY